MTTFASDLEFNKQGQLAGDQLAALQRMFRARIVTGWILILCSGFVGVLTLFGLIVGGPFLALLVVTIGMFASVAYGMRIIRSNKRARLGVEDAPVEQVMGVPIKCNYSTPVRVPVPGTNVSAMQFIRVPAGWIKIDDNPVGVVPSPLYSEIADREEATFFYIPLTASGFKDRLIVNYLPR